MPEIELFSPAGCRNGIYAIVVDRRLEKSRDYEDILAGNEIIKRAAL